MPSTGHRRLVSGEEFEDYLEHPDPVPLALFLRSEASRAVPADSNARSGCGQQDGECTGVLMLL
uniref:Uncharacterized protein n=1 Tax=Triticum urartu TaxID=4572 RepID=A0A8R7TSM2_TRIUA